MVRVLLFVLLSSMSLLIYGQQLNLPLIGSFQEKYNQQFYDTVSNLHTSFKPFISSIAKFNDTKFINTKTRFHRLEKILTQESLIKIGNDSASLTIDPLFYLEQSIDKTNKTHYTRNTRGFWIRGNVGNNFSFESSFLENQITTPNYLTDFVTQYKVFPGMGRTKVFKQTGYDYAMASGYISFMPIKKLNIQFGHGKLFVGNGYRSLLVSDNSFNYPHFKTTYNFNKFQYTWVVASLMNLSNPTIILFAEPLFRKKQASFHTLSYKPNKRFEIALFQGVVYAIDATKFNWNAVNPLIFSQLVSYGLGTKNNVLIGVNTNAKLTNNLLVYAQLMCDDFSKVKNSVSNKTGYQLGVYYKNIAGIKNFNSRLEYNLVRPFAYQHGYEAQAYTHYNQSLSHPLNANFKEIVSLTNYSYKRFLINLKIVGARVGVNTINFNAGNILTISTNKNGKGNNYNDIIMLRGELKNLLVQDYSIGYLINPSYNFCLRAGYFTRNYTGSNVNYVYIGVSAFIFNQYLDF